MASEIERQDFEAAWVRCQVKASLKAGEAFVKVDAEGVPGPLGFYVDHTLVRPEDPPQEDTDGTVQVIILSQANGSTSVQVLGEPVSFGPRITIPSSLVESA